MKRIVCVTMTALLMLALLASCRTTVPKTEPEPTEAEVVIPDPEPAPQPEPEPEPQPEPTAPEPTAPEPTAPAWKTGDIGPGGGIVFECSGLFLETGEPIYEAGAFDEAKALVPEPYRLPEIGELVNLFWDLVEPGLLEIDWTYYWSCTEVDEDSVMVMNFDTGFEGRFYKNMDFVSVIPVRELH